MVSVTVICVGKLKEKYYKDAANEYEKRLNGYCKVEIIELPETRLCEMPTQAQIEAALEKEAEAIFARIPKGAVVTAMCVEGEGLSSESFAKRISQDMVQGASKLVFIIGGSFGLSPQIKRAAKYRLSMSNMTFPHHLARVMVLEQIYRAFKINEGSSYHK